MTHSNQHYEAPTAELIEVQVERGFAGSNPVEAPGYRGTNPWG